MNISKKLILSFVGLTSIVLLATLLLARWSFEKGFTEFLHAQEQARLGRIARDILDEYSSAQLVNQEFDNTRLNRIINLHSFGKAHPQRLGGLHRVNRPQGPPGHRVGKKRPDLAPPIEDREQGPRPRMRPPGRENDELIPTAFYSSGGLLLASSFPETFSPEQSDVYHIMIQQPLVINGQSIGMLTSWQKERVSSSIEGTFSQQQLVTSILIGLFSLILSICLAMLGAKKLVAPIKQTIAGISRLSSGDYKNRMVNDRYDEFGDLIDDINHLAEKLEQTQSAKNRWFADISHELRTPLTVLMGELEAIKVGVRPMDTKSTDSLIQETQLLNRLIDDLYQLSMSDIGALRYEKTTFDFSSLVSKTCDQFVLSAQAKSLSLHKTIASNIQMTGDADRLSQLLSNILNNSIAYTDPKGSVQVRLVSTVETIELSIEDTAPSLSEPQCNDIFEPLYRHQKARTRNAGGAGLGLAICKNIVHAHGGQINASPSDLGGIKINVKFRLSMR